MKATVPPDPSVGGGLVRLRTKTSVDDLDQSLVTPPTKRHKQRSPAESTEARSTPSSTVTPASFLGFQTCWYKNMFMRNVCFQSLLILYSVTPCLLIYTCSSGWPGASPLSVQLGLKTIWVNLWFICLAFKCWIKWIWLLRTERIPQSRRLRDVQFFPVCTLVAHLPSRRLKSCSLQLQEVAMSECLG